MEWRVTRLEQETKEVRADLRSIQSDLAEIRAKLAVLATANGLSQVEARLAGVEGKVSQLPTTWVMLTGIVASQIAMAGMITGLVFAVARLLGKG